MANIHYDLMEMAKLEAGWDSYGGKPITNDAIRTASDAKAVPVADGGVQIELHAGKADIEIRIGPDGVVRWLSFERH